MSVKREILSAEYRHQIVCLKKEESIQKNIYEGGNIFVYPLYGTVASVTYGNKYDKFFPFVNLLDLCTKMPSVSLKMVDDGCISFQAEEYVNSIPIEKKSKVIKEIFVSPIVCNVEEVNKYFSLEWISKISNGDLVRVTVHLGKLPLNIGTYVFKKNEFLGGFKYEKSNFSPDGSLKKIWNNKTGLMIEMEKPIIWAGSSREPNRISFYYNHCDYLSPNIVGLEIIKQIVKQGTVNE